MRVEHLGRSRLIHGGYQHEPVNDVNDVSSNGEHGRTSDRPVDFDDSGHSDNGVDNAFDRCVDSAQTIASVKRWSAA